MPNNRELPFANPHIDYRAAQRNSRAPNIRAHTTPIIERLWDTRKPESLLESLMVAAPADAISDWPDLQPLIAAVTACVDQLQDEHRYVIEAIFYERASYSELGWRLGCSKTHAWRITQAAMRELGTLLQNDPTIRSRYMAPVPETWEQAAAEWVTDLSDGQQEPNPIDIHSPIRLRDMIVRTYDKSGKVAPIAAFKGIAYDAIGHLRTMGPDGWDPNEMTALLVSKQRDYGHGNINAFGLYGILVRLSDKIERLQNLMANNREPSNESFRDTLLDMVGYCVIAHMLDEESFDLPLGDRHE